jgi:MraZ protein
MFRGHHEHTIDRKGRVAIPAKFRRKITEEYGEHLLMITRLDECLVVHPRREWTKIEEKARTYDRNNPAVLHYLRYTIGWVEECPMDRQGRILVPPALRGFAGLEHEVIIVGTLDCFEIWDKGRFKAQDQKTALAFQEMMDKLSKMES